MSQHEGEPPGGPRYEPPAAFALPPELAEFLSGTEYAMVTQGSDQGAVYVVKTPGRDIAGLHGPVPIEMTHELHHHPLAPVIRSVVRIFDQPERPLAMESFINVAEEEQWRDFADLADQDEHLLLFYDESLAHRLTKRVPNQAQGQMSTILTWADRVRQAISDAQYNFDRAKADVMRRTKL